ncbi:MAG: hypothetical protein ACRD0E_03440, partial [Acidimicrobiales bacterium]
MNYLIEGAVGKLRTMADEPMARAALVARLKAPYRRRQFHSFGSGSILHRPNWLYGTASIAIGDGVLVLPGAWLAVERSAWEAQPPVIR